MAKTSKATRSASKVQPPPAPLPTAFPKSTKVKTLKSKKAAPPPVNSTSSSEGEQETGEQEEVLRGSDKPSGKDAVEGSDEEQEGGDDDYLRGFSSDDDSSDEELEAAAIDVGKLPTIAKDDASVQRKLAKAKSEPVSIFLWSNVCSKMLKHSFVKRPKSGECSISAGFPTGFTKIN